MPPRVPGPHAAAVRPTARRRPRTLPVAALLAAGLLAGCTTTVDRPQTGSQGVPGEEQGGAGGLETGAEPDGLASPTGDADEDGEASGESGAGGTTEDPVVLTDADGREVGRVVVEDAEGGTRVQVEVSGLEPGFHGFHVHEVGACEPDSAAPDDPSRTGAFLSAGGHLGGTDGDHGSHAGDLPSLLVAGDGSAMLSVTTDGFAPADLADDDGSAFMVHAGPDNSANVPERYASGGPDEETLRTGDSGGRVACGVLTR
jgi:superoxide dismutase, Cu-Zn family